LEFGVHRDLPPVASTNIGTVTLTIIMLKTFTLVVAEEESIL